MERCAFPPYPRRVRRRPVSTIFASRMGGSGSPPAPPPPREIDDVQLSADASSLAGPFHVSGQFSGPAGAPVVFRVASEKAGPAGTPLRASVDAGPSWPALEFDGALADPGPAAKGPSLYGSGTLVGVAPGAGGPIGWRAAGRMTINLDRAAIEEAQFRFGPEERAVSADGAATLTYASPADSRSRRRRNRSISMRSCAARGRTASRRRALWRRSPMRSRQFLPGRAS